MNDYEINAQTLAIIPIGTNKSKIIEEHGNLIVNKPPIKIIDDSCRFFGSSYDGRFLGTKQMTGITHKSPIIIEETRKIIFFPTNSPRNEKCIWLSLNNINCYEENGNECTIKFCCGKKISISSSYTIIDNQILRATRLESVLARRMEKV